MMTTNLRRATFFATTTALLFPSWCTRSAIANPSTIEPKAFWDNDWPSDLRRLGSNNDNDDATKFEFPSTGLEYPYVLKGHPSSLSEISSDVLADLYNDDSSAGSSQEVEVETQNGSWIPHVYLPGATQIPNLSKFQLTCNSGWGVTVHYNNGISKKVNYGEKLILALIDGSWLDEEAHDEIATPSPTASPTAAGDNGNPPLLEGTVLFAQSQVLPSKHRINGDENRQPHLTAARKTLVLLKPRGVDDLDSEIEMTVRDGDGNLLSSSSPIMMNDPENVPKHDGWIDLGEGISIDDIEFPSSLDSPYVIEGQSNLNTVIGVDEDGTELAKLMNRPDRSHEVEIKTWSGSWVKNIHLPRGSDVPEDSKIQVTCNSGYDVTVRYLEGDGVSWRAKRLSNGERVVIVLVNGIWVAPDDLEHNEYIFGHGFYTATLEAEWVQPGMTLEFATTEESNWSVGLLDDIDIGGVTELVITTLDAGFLTPPRNEFSFRDDPTLHREYYETAPLSRLVVAQYESLHLTEVMLPSGKLYTDVSDDDNGGWHSGDMRQYTGKILLSHGIDMANYGIHSSLGSSESSHPFTCAMLAAHNTVGLYQNGRQVHGGSGGNGMVTLDSSIGNELSHEVGHNYGLGHYPGGFDGSVHRPSHEVNSAWGWDSDANVFVPNFSPKNTGGDQCLDGKCQGPYLGKYKYGTDSMAGGSPQHGINRYTMYTPNTARVIQKFLEGRAVWDPSSSTGFRKYNHVSRNMDEFENEDNGGKVPIEYRVPVTTIVGYYDPDHSGRGLQSYVYPALHGAYGFAYGDDSASSDAGGCKLVVETNESGTLVYDLSTSVDSKGMNKFHVNVATKSEPHKASVYCQDELLAERALDGPNPNEPPLTYTVNGIPFDDDEDADDDDDVPTDSPTELPTESPTASPTEAKCENVEEFEWRVGKVKTCDSKWLKKRIKKKGLKKACNSKAKPSNKRIKELCPEKCEVC